jgi:YrbI family 3-deoxy-D-manno-octulosonate 8-phosphate phosphatase
MDVSVIAIIPARGSSKGIPRKNLQLLNGVPLIGRTIRSARGSRHVGRVVVSTDDDAIARTAREYGAEVIMRPAEISGDLASSEAALLHVLAQLEETESCRPDIVVFLQCTSPFTTAEDIDGAIDTLLDADADNCFSAVPFHHFVWQNEPDGSASGVNHNPAVREMRQERRAQLLETGSVYVMRAAGFLEHGHRFFGKTVAYIVHPSHSLEIDEPRDLRLARMIVRDEPGGGASALPTKVSALVLDFDGVLTDNRVLVRQDGMEAVWCSRGDGLGIEQLMRLGIPVLVLSKEKNPVVSARCAKLGVECLQGIDDKWSALEQWLASRKLSPDDLVYVGNDINDASCLRNAGCGVVVADAAPEVLDTADIVLSSPGGRGAVREICNMIAARTLSRI